jgi:TM2 domain-containing membrane protein YozV
MPTVAPSTSPTSSGTLTAPAPAHRSDALAALLSYLVPGLGQVYQGRTAKGILFFVCIYGLFFYGMFLGSGTARVNGEEYRLTGNVYLPDTANNDKGNPLGLPPLAANLYSRPQFAGQFWVGIVAWPAVWQYITFDGSEKGKSIFGNFERTPSEQELNAVQTCNDKRMDLGWVFTVIAGVLNIMVIYDAFAGPAFLAAPAPALEGSRS